MNVRTDHHIEAGPSGPDGNLAYRYEYDVVVFSVGNRSLVARSYADTPHEAHFLRIEIGDQQRQLTGPDIQGSLFVEAVAYLRDAGKTEISWLSGQGNGYEPIPI